MFLRYFYNFSVSQENVKRSPEGTTFNVADFQKKNGKPMFDPEKMIPIEKDENPEGKRILSNKNVVRVKKFSWINFKSAAIFPYRLY